MQFAALVTVQRQADVGEVTHWKINSLEEGNGEQKKENGAEQEGNEEKLGK
jgi:hypothetical protein